LLHLTQELEKLVKDTKEGFNKGNKLEALNKFYWYLLKPSKIVVSGVDGNNIFVSNMGGAIGSKGAHVKLLERAIGKVNLVPTRPFEFVAEIKLSERCSYRASLKYSHDVIEEMESIFGKDPGETIFDWRHTSTHCLDRDKITELRKKYLLIQFHDDNQDNIIRVYK